MSLSTSAPLTELPPSTIPIFTTIAAYREWRNAAFKANKSVGFVATMGALHDGHVSLVKHSLAENDLTVVSIFVNPAQFAPHEDLATYPRTLAHDLSILEATSSAAVPIPNTTGASTSATVDDAPVRTPDAVFAPTVSEMYPSGITQNLDQQKGTFVEVCGFSHQMEGRTRPTFFRGVATVVTKLFNIIQPTRTYFGQKDIQQALLLRRMTRDLLLAHPTPENLHIVPIARDPTTHLALSSRNAYLSPRARQRAAPALAAALRAASDAWARGETKAAAIGAGQAVVDKWWTEAGAGDDEQLTLDYLEMNDPETFDVVGDGVTLSAWESDSSLDSEAAAKGKGEKRGKGRPVILSGAMYVGTEGVGNGRTRLIDNVVLGDAAAVGVVGA